MNREDWVCLATGPSATSMFGRAVLDSAMTSRVITCNAGLRIYKNPDIYWISDRGAMSKYKEDYTEYADNGGQIVAGDKYENNIGVDHDVFEYYEEHGGGAYENQDWHGRTSGVVMIRYLISEKNPDIIRLVGYDGYDRSGNRARNDPNSAAQKALRNIFESHENISFIWYSPTGRLM